MPKEKARPGETLVARNKRASFDYDLGDRFEAGIVLKGSEVKMLRAGKADLTDSFCTVFRGEAFLLGVSIVEMTGAAFGHLAKSQRKLLLHRREIDRLKGRMEQKGLALIPLSLYFQRGFAKLELGLGRGKKLYDKREDIAKRDVDRETQRELAGRG